MKKKRRIKSVAVSPRMQKAGGLLFIVALLYVFWLPDVSTLAKTNPSTTAFISARGDALPSTWIPYEKIPRALIRAVVVAEDSQFWNHDGVDFNEIWSSLKEAWLDLQLPRGASTITQQLAKNLYLSDSYNPLRKIKEYFIARRLESALSKKRILEIYLNVIEWGPHVYGVSEAARIYFHRSPQTLSEAQAAYLAAIIPNPITTFNPVLHAERVMKRQRIILRKMESVQN